LLKNWKLYDKTPKNDQGLGGKMRPRCTHFPNALSELCTELQTIKSYGSGYTTGSGLLVLLNHAIQPVRLFARLNWDSQLIPNAVLTLTLMRKRYNLNQ